MKLDDLVCDLEYAKRLKELCVPQESLFYWIMPNHDAYAQKGKWLLELGCNITKIELHHSEYYSALTASELLNNLPAQINSKSATGCDYNLRIYKRDGLWYVGYIGTHLYQNKLICADLKLENCAAVIYLSLIENGFIEVPK